MTTQHEGPWRPVAFCLHGPRMHRFCHKGAREQSPPLRVSPHGRPSDHRRPLCPHDHSWDLRSVSRPWPGRVASADVPMNHFLVNLPTMAGWASPGAYTYSVVQDSRPHGQSSISGLAPFLRPLPCRRRAPLNQLNRGSLAPYAAAFRRCHRFRVDRRNIG